MKRWEPIAYPGPDNVHGAATHRNFNQSTGERGSWPDGLGYQQIIDELCGARDAAGLSPDLDGTKTDQILRTIQFFGGVHCGVAAGTANALAITAEPARENWAELLNVPLRFVVAAVNTGPATVTESHIGSAKDLVDRFGAPLSGGELRPGMILTGIYNGAHVRLLEAGRGLTLVNTIVQLAAGTFTWTKQPWCRAVEVEPQGGGGGGAGAASGAGACSMSGGGAGGAWLRKLLLASALSPTETYIVAPGGLGGAYSGAGSVTGAPGGLSSFGSHVSAGGGAGGQEMPAGTSTATTGASVGGVATGGDISRAGENGDAGYRYNGSQGRAGDGGGSFFAPRALGQLLTQAGLDGRGPGGGGAGASSLNGTPTTASYKGGDGKAGLMIIREYA